MKGFYAVNWAELRKRIEVAKNSHFTNVFVFSYFRLFSYFSPTDPDRSFCVIKLGMKELLIVNSKCLAMIAILLLPIYHLSKIDQRERSLLLRNCRR